MRTMMAILLMGLCSGCAKQAKAPPVATAPTVAPVQTTVKVDLSTSQPPPVAKPMPTAEEAMAGKRRVSVSSDVANSRVVARPTPLVYPAEAKAKHLSGIVVLHAVIGTDGSVSGLTVVRASDPVFIPAAIATVENWHYKPYVLNGKAVQVDTKITVNFRMK